MFQCVRLSISSSVIMFHRERKECGPENGKTEGEAGTTHQSPKAEKGGSVRTAATNRGKTAGTTRKTEANRKDGTQTAKENCNMQSWERAQPLSPFEVSPDGTGRRFCLENSGWRDPLGYHNAAKYPPADFSLTLYYAS